ncbi:MAG: lipoyl(octanoyl) transferase LipB [Gammaproteobacteria bacterium]|nr:lipoyl(octanoyl) transferase LipB [Gammaproteobacteria bacterium]
MRAFTDARDDNTVDEFWLTEHRGVFTQGQAGKAEHVLAPGGIEVVQTDRGGQVTYHGPGQIVGYLMFDIRRMGLNVRALVTGIEASMVRVLACYGIDAAPRADAPGVYVAGAKIGALGLRVRRGSSYHGLSLNVAMDLEPFTRINPCGLTDLSVTQISNLLDTKAGQKAPEIEDVEDALVEALAATFAFSAVRRMSGNWDPASA